MPVTEVLQAILEVPQCQPKIIRLSTCLEHFGNQKAERQTRTLVDGKSMSLRCDSCRLGSDQPHHAGEWHAAGCTETRRADCSALCAVRHFRRRAGRRLLCHCGARKGHQCPRCGSARSQRSHADGESLVVQEIATASQVYVRCMLFNQANLQHCLPNQALRGQVAGFLCISCPFALTDALRERWDTTQQPRGLHLLWGVISGDYERGLSRCAGLCQPPGPSKQLSSRVWSLLWRAGS